MKLINKIIKNNIMYCILMVLLSGIFLYQLINNSFYNWLLGTFSSNASNKILFYSKAILKDNEYISAYLNRALTWEKNNYQNAVNDCDMAMKINPLNQLNWLALGLINEKIGDYNSAMNDYSYVIYLDSAFPWGYYYRSELFYKLSENSYAIIDSAIFYRLLKNNTEALKILDNFIKINPLGYLAYEQRALIKYELKNFNDAINDFDRLIELSPSYTWGYYYRALSYKQTSNLSQAINDLNKAISIDPLFSEAFYELAIIYIEIKDSNKALQNLYNSGYTHLIHNRKNDADLCLNKIMEINNNSEWFRKLKEQILLFKK